MYENEGIWLEDANINMTVHFSQGYVFRNLEVGDDFVYYYK